MHGVRRLWCSGPFSTVSPSVVMCANRSRTVSPHGTNRSTQPSLVTWEVTPYPNSFSHRRGVGGGLGPLQEGAGWLGDQRPDGVRCDRTACMQKAEVAHLHEASGEDVWEEPAYKLEDVEAGGA